jgi:hypothetical protein
MDPIGPLEERVPIGTTFESPFELISGVMKQTTIAATGGRDRKI